jgi:hypothetical protein
MYVDVIRMQAGATYELDDVLRSAGKPKATVPARNPPLSGPLWRVHHDGACHTGRIRHSRPLLEEDEEGVSLSERWP